MKKFAFILSGCGGLDGTEVHEALYSFLAVRQHNCDYKCFAENKDQVLVKNFLDNSDIKEKRNVLVESARLAKYDNIHNLNELNPDEFDILFLPGGYGAVINIATHLQDSENYTVSKKVEEIILAFKKANKPICAVCIAPMILAKVLKNVDLTIGNMKEKAKIIENLGNKHLDTKSGDICVDRENKIITSPCFMATHDISAVYNEVYKVVEEAIKLSV